MPVTRCGSCVTLQDFEGLVSMHGLEFWLLRGNTEQLMESNEFREVLENWNLIAFIDCTLKRTQRLAFE